MGERIAGKQDRFSLIIEDPPQGPQNTPKIYIFFTFWPINEKMVFKLFPLVVHTVQITFIFIDFRVCDFAFAFKTQNAPCVSRFKRVLFSDRFQFAF